MKVYTTLGDGIDALKLSEIPKTELKANEILVKISAVSLNFRDLLVINGVGDWKPETRRIPTSDGVGEVVGCGENVSRVKTGDCVAGIFLPKWLNGELTAEKYVLPLGGAAKDGVLTEYVIFNEQSVVKVPKNLSFEESSTLPVAAITAWHSVTNRSRVKNGETVLIQGTGGVSLFAMQFVNALGGKSFVISSSDEKLEKVENLGAFKTVNYKKNPDWEDQILDLTDGKGVDHVIEIVGGENFKRIPKRCKNKRNNQLYRFDRGFESTDQYISICYQKRQHPRNRNRFERNV